MMRLWLNDDDHQNNRWIIGHPQTWHIKEWKTIYYTTLNEENKPLKMIYDGRWNRNSLSSEYFESELILQLKENIAKIDEEKILSDTMELVKLRT